MSDYDQDILRQAERDGVRTMSGHHIRIPEPPDEDEDYDGGEDGEGNRDWKLDR